MKKAKVGSVGLISFRHMSEMENKWRCEMLTNKEYESFGGSGCLDAVLFHAMDEGRGEVDVED